MMSSSRSNSNRSISCNPLSCCFAILVCAGLAFNIAAIVVSTEHADDPCQAADKSRVSLHGWLLVSGIVGLCASVIMAGSLCGLLVFEWENCFFPAAVVTIFNSLFVLAWFIVGVVIVARSNHSCVDDSTPLGVMSVIMLVIQGLSVCSMRCTASAGSSAN